MAPRVSGKRYAEAIFELALQEGEPEPWMAQLEMARDVLQDPEFGAFLKHADVPAERKIGSIETVLSELHPLVRNMLNLLVSRGLTDLAPEVCDAYQELLDRHAGRQRVGVTLGS